MTRPVRCDYCGWRGDADYPGACPRCEGDGLVPASTPRLDHAGRVKADLFDSWAGRDRAYAARAIVAVLLQRLGGSSRVAPEDLKTIDGLSIAHRRLSDGTLTMAMVRPKKGSGLEPLKVEGGQQIPPTTVEPEFGEEFDPANAEHQKERLETRAKIEAAWDALERDGLERLNALSEGRDKPGNKDVPLLMRCVSMCATELGRRKWNREDPENRL